jgi:hypothetical protein
MLQGDLSNSYSLISRIRHEDAEMSSNRLAVFIGAVVTSCFASQPTSTFAQLPAVSAPHTAPTSNEGKHGVSHPPVDAASDADVSTSLPLQAPYSSSDLLKPPASSTPDAPLPKPY